MVALEALEAHYWTSENLETPVLRTAPPDQWIEWGKRLLSMFGQDLVLKRTIVTALTRSSGENRTQLLLYLNAWLSSPLVDPFVVSSITEMANTELEEVTPRNASSSASSSGNSATRPSSASSTPTRDSSASSSSHTPSSSKSPASLQPNAGGNKTPKSTKTSPSKKSSSASKSPSAPKSRR